MSGYKAKTTRTGRKMHLAGVGSTRAFCGTYVYENAAIPASDDIAQVAVDLHRLYPHAELCVSCFGTAAYVK